MEIYSRERWKGKNKEEEDKSVIFVSVWFICFTGYEKPGHASHDTITFWNDIL